MSSARRPRLSWFRLYADDMQGGICALSAAECGRYLLLLLAQWASRESQIVTADPERLRLICRGEDPGPSVLAKFVRLENGLRNVRLAGEWEAAKDEYDRKAKGGGDRTDRADTAPESAQIPPRSLPATKNQEPRTKIQEPKPKLTNGPTSLRSEVLAVFTYWQDVMAHGDSRLGKDRVRVIEARLKEGYTVDQIKAAIDGCKASAWHMGENERRKRYDGLELICRSAEHLDRFRNGVKITVDFVDAPLPPAPTAEQQEASRREWERIRPTLGAQK